MKVKMWIGAVVGGILVTLLSGLLSNTPTGLVGAEHYGYPLAWLIRLIVAPEYFPWKVDFVNLIVDIIVWAVVVAIILNFVVRSKKK